MNNPTIKALLVKEVFYWNCRLNGMTALLAGPFLEASQAEECGDYVGPACVEEQPETRKASFGVVQMKAPGLGPGKYNHLLPPELQGEILIESADTGVRH